MFCCLGEPPKRRSPLGRINYRWLEVSCSGRAIKLVLANADILKQFWCTKASELTVTLPNG